MKIFLNFEDLKKLILDSYNGVNEVTVEDDSVEFLLDVDGDNFYRLKNNQKPVKEELISNDISKNVSVTQKTDKKINLNDTPDFDALLKEKPLIDSGVHLPKVKTLEEQNEEAMQKGLMTTGRGSSRALQKF